jgi:hypothetical protein
MFKLGGSSNYSIIGAGLGYGLGFEKLKNFGGTIQYGETTLIGQPYYISDPNQGADPDVGHIVH